MLVHADIKLCVKISQALLRLNAIKPGNKASNEPPSTTHYLTPTQHSVGYMHYALTEPIPYKVKQ